MALQLLPEVPRGGAIAFEGNALNCEGGGPGTYGVDRLICLVFIAKSAESTKRDEVAGSIRRFGRSVSFSRCACVRRHKAHTESNERRCRALKPATAHLQDSSRALQLRERCQGEWGARPSAARKARCRCCTCADKFAEERLELHRFVHPQIDEETV